MQGLKQASSTNTPNFLSASSPQGLRRLMLLNNRRFAKMFAYDIHFANGRWFAWYYNELVDERLAPSVEEVDA